MNKKSARGRGRGEHNQRYKRVTGRRRNLYNHYNVSTQTLRLQGPEDLPGVREGHGGSGDGLLGHAGGEGTLVTLIY